MSVVTVCAPNGSTEIWRRQPLTKTAAPVVAAPKSTSATPLRRSVSDRAPHAAA